MRWKPPSERAKFIMALPAIVIGVPVLLIALAPMIAFEWVRRQWQRRQAADPRRAWLAWRPVRFDGFWEDVPSQWLWLERVQCRWERGEWQYYPLGFVSRYDEPVVSSGEGEKRGG